MKKILIIISLIVCFILGACTTMTVNADQTNPIKIWKQNENGRMQTYYVVDEKTGVNYIVVGGASMYGDHSMSVSITPRLNADGTLYVTP